MGTLLRVDPSGGCSATVSSTALVGATLKSGSVTALAAADGSYYQVNPKTTTRTSPTTIGQTSITVASAAGFPPSGSYYVRIDNEATAGAGGRGPPRGPVARGRLDRGGASHASGATVSALATDWYGGFTGVKSGSSNLRVTYAGKNCDNTTGTGCNPLTT